jgi:hypothetical protein
MTPGEQNLMRMILREEIDTAITPVREDLAKLTERTSKLEKTDAEIQKKVSGQHRAVTKEIIPQLQSAAEDARRGDMAGVGDAFNKIVYVLADMGDSIAQMRAEMQPRAVVELPDGKGGTSVRPASLVAAESSVRTENRQESLAKLTLDASIDTTKAKDNSADAKKAAQRAFVTSLVFGVVVGLWQAWQFIQHAGASP